MVFHENTGDMPGTENDQLTSYLQQGAGEYLRGVVSYEGDEYEVRYIRDDLRTTRLKSEVDTMIDYAVNLGRVSVGRFPLGN